MTIKLEEITTVKEEVLPVVWCSLITAILLQDYLDFKAVEGDVANLSEEEKEVYWAEYIVENSLPFLDLSNDLKSKLGNLARRHASVMSDVFDIAVQIISTQVKTKDEYDFCIHHLMVRFGEVPQWKIFSDMEDRLTQADMEKSINNAGDEE